MTQPPPDGRDPESWVDQFLDLVDQDRTDEAVGRRHVSHLLYALAVVGVPAAVIFATGGPETIGFLDRWPWCGRPR
jgi:hypothetical protein